MRAVVGTPCDRRISHQGEASLGKYVLGWIMGVPVILLVVIYLIFN